MGSRGTASKRRSRGGSGTEPIASPPSNTTADVSQQGDQGDTGPVFQWRADFLALSRTFGPWQRHHEGGTFTEDTPHPNIAAVAVDDLMRNGKP